MTRQAEYDVLVIGGGIAGLSVALRLADRARVALLAKGPLTEGSSLYAQGGIAAVLDSRDSVEAHVNDTLGAGCGLCHEEIVSFTVERGPECIRWLIDLGVPFTKESRPADHSAYHLTREGGHSRRRIIHAADATGHASAATLERHVRNHDNVDIFENHIAVDLVTGKKLGLSAQRCLGAYVLDRQASRVKVFRSRAVVLATGGASKVYLYTSNPDVSTGDGIAMAWRAGCRVANMEFVQFHPTCLYHPAAKSFLISEAVRGEGGRLMLPDGDRFMRRFDDRAELASRDVVARAIDYEMKRLGLDCVHLDISHKPAGFIKRRFPTIYARCMQLGYDMTSGPLPVVPAAHYTCGGVVTDRSGRTDIAGLYAVGEIAHTGLHGANRLASNSILECLTFAASASEDIASQLCGTDPPPPLPEWDESWVEDSDEEVVVSHNWHELRRAMWDYVGIVRTDKRLERAQRRVAVLRNEIHDYYSRFRLTNDLIELRNLALAADLIVRSAIQRKESRGLHYTLDYPTPSESASDTVLTPSA
ncbi:MAG: L-aspartate oxidase [Gemmatimonadales bacterium]